MSEPPFSLGLTSEALVSEVQPRIIAKLWRRVAAFLLDVLILSIAIHLLAIFLYDQFVHLDAWGPLVGFALVMPYFALLNSNVFNGQTIGKALLGVQVVDAHGNLLSPLRASLRYLVLTFPMACSNLELPLTRVPGIFVHYVVPLFQAVTLVTLYLMIFNRATRQGLHDLVADSYVVRADSPGEVKPYPIWKGHWAILIVLAIGAYVGGNIFRHWIASKVDMSQLTQDLRVIENMPGVQSAGIVDQVSRSSNDTRTTTCVVTVRWTGRTEDMESIAKTVGKKLIEIDSGTAKHDTLGVTVIRGYNLGIASSYRTYRCNYTLEEWKKGTGTR